MNAEGALLASPAANKKAANESWRLQFFLFLAGDGARDTLAVFVQQHALGFFGIHRPVKQLVVFEEDLDERRAHSDRSLNQSL